MVSCHMAICSLCVSEQNSRRCRYANHPDGTMNGEYLALIALQQAGSCSHAGSRPPHVPSRASERLFHLLLLLFAILCTPVMIIMQCMCSAVC